MIDEKLRVDARGIERDVRLFLPATHALEKINLGSALLVDAFRHDADVHRRTSADSDRTNAAA